MEIPLKTTKRSVRKLAAAKGKESGKGKSTKLRCCNEFMAQFKQKSQGSSTTGQQTGDNLKALQTRMKRDNKHNSTQLSKRTRGLRWLDQKDKSRDRAIQPRTTSCKLFVVCYGLPSLGHLHLAPEKWSWPCQRLKYNKERGAQVAKSTVDEWVVAIP